MGSRVKSVSLSLLFLVFLFFQAGCISFGPAPPRGEPGQGPGAPPATTGMTGGPFEENTLEGAPRASLSTALSALSSIASPGVEGGIDVKDMSLVKVWGHGVDSSGLARSWLLGLRNGGRNALLSYSGGELAEEELPVTLPDGELPMDDFISPEELFRKNLNAIVKEMSNIGAEECDLTLEQGTYLVTIESETESTTLSFNARTGEEKASP